MLGSNCYLRHTISRDAKQSQGQLAVLPAAFRDNSEPRASIRTRFALRESSKMCKPQYLKYLGITI